MSQETIVLRIRSLSLVSYLRIEERELELELEAGGLK
jgi:hypothetical protein